MLYTIFLEAVAAAGIVTAFGGAVCLAAEWWTAR